MNKPTTMRELIEQQAATTFRDLTSTEVTSLEIARDELSQAGSAIRNYSIGLTFQRLVPFSRQELGILSAASHLLLNKRTQINSLLLAGKIAVDDK